MGSDDPITMNTLVDTGTNYNNAYQGLISNVGPSTDSGLGWATGLTTAEAVWEISEGLEKGDVTLVALGATATALDFAAMTDPFSYLGAQIISWMLEHIEPARQALESVTGNPAMVKAYAASWVNIQQHMTTIRDDLRTAVDGITSWEGEAAEAYKTRAGSLIEQAHAAAGAAYGASVATQKMAEVVNGVRTAVRDLLSAIASAMIIWTAELLFTAGTGTPLVVAQATSKIAWVISMAAKEVDKVTKAIGDLSTWAVVVKDLVDGLYRAETTSTG